jgi:hypothetical protein
MKCCDLVPYDERGIGADCGCRGLIYLRQRAHLVGLVDSINLLICLLK